MSVKFSAQLDSDETETPVTREEWLNWAIDFLRPEFQKRGYILAANINVSLGWPRSRKVRGETAGLESLAKGNFDIFVSPVVNGALEAIDVLTHECCHTLTGRSHRPPFQRAANAMGLEGPPAAMSGLQSPRWLAWALPLAVKLDAFPHEAWPTQRPKPGKKPLTSRMLKCECPKCGCSIRTSRRWLEAVQTPRCINPKCSGQLIREQ